MNTKSIVKKVAALSILSLAGLRAYSEADGAPQEAPEPSQTELEAVWQEAEPIIEDELAKEATRSAVRYPCALFDKEAAGALLSAKVDAPEFAHEFKTVTNADTGESSTWEAEACSWNNWGDGASMNIWVSRRDQFPDGKVLCHGIYDEDKTESLFGGTAKWEFLESFGWAKLLVCRDDTLFFAEIHDGPMVEAEARRVAAQVAMRIVNSLK
jgi:hypothetical protein